MAAPFDTHGNGAYGTVLTAPSPATTGTSLVLNSGQGANFPSPATVNYNCVVWPAGQVMTKANSEVVRVTALATDTFTITREQEGTTARTIVAGDQFALAVTAKLFTDIETALAVNVQEFLADGTWTNPSATMPATARVLIECWGAGGSGGKASANGSGGGGGGGAYHKRWMDLADISGNQAVTVGTGGPAQGSADSGGTAGEDTSFGAHLTAYGGGAGGAGSATTGGGGGGGGGQTSAGSNAVTTTGGAGGGPSGAVAAGAGAAIEQNCVMGGGGGRGGGTVQAAATRSENSGHGSAVEGGGGGGGGRTSGGGDQGGGSVYGGGGGGGGSGTGAVGAGGFSIYGGAGGTGATGAANGGTGSVPGGGGGGAETGSSGAGADGMVRVTVFP